MYLDFEAKTFQYGCSFLFGNNEANVEENNDVIEQYKDLTY